MQERLSLIGGVHDPEADDWDANWGASGENEVQAAFYRLFDALSDLNYGNVFPD